LVAPQFALLLTL